MNKSILGSIFTIDFIRHQTKSPQNNWKILPQDEAQFQLIRYFSNIEDMAHIRGRFRAKTKSDIAGNDYIIVFTLSSSLDPIEDLLKLAKRFNQLIFSDDSKYQLKQKSRLEWCANTHEGSVSLVWNPQKITFQLTISSIV